LSAATVLYGQQSEMLLLTARCHWVKNHKPDECTNILE